MDSEPNKPILKGHGASKKGSKCYGATIQGSCAINQGSTIWDRPEIANKQGTDATIQGR